MITTKQCRICKIPQSNKNFYKSNEHKDGLNNVCKKCKYIKGKKWRKDNFDRISKSQKEWRDKNKDKTKEYSSRARIRDRAKILARSKFNYAKRLGNIEVPSECSECGIGSLPLEGHHPNYLKPLDVIWLCIKCHGQEHRKLNEIKRKNYVEKN